MRASKLGIPLLLFGFIQAAPGLVTESDPGSATLYGTVTDEAGVALAGVTVAAYAGYRCDSTVCVLAHGYWQNSTETAEDGSWTIRAPAAGIHVEARFQDGRDRQYGAASTDLTVRAAESHRLDLVLAASLPLSVNITGRVYDREDGRPIDRADIRPWNFVSGQHAPSIRTDEDGRFVTRQTGGRLFLWVEVETFADEPCAEPIYQDGLAERRLCPVQVQPYFYHTYLRYVPLVESEELAIDVPLARIVNRTAVANTQAQVVGWIVDAETNEPIVDAQVAAYHEATFQWGSTRTDQDGAYRISVTAGHLIIQVQAQGREEEWTMLDVPNRGITHRNVLLRHGVTPQCCWGFVESYEIPMDGPAPPPPERPLMQPDPDMYLRAMTDIPPAQWNQWQPSRPQWRDEFAGLPAQIGPYDPELDLTWPPPKVDRAIPGSISMTAAALVAVTLLVASARRA